jgi:hypothetical protein
MAVQGPKNRGLRFQVEFIGLVAYQGKDIVSRFIVEYSSLREFGP